MGRLISGDQIRSNLRRTASKGYISLLNEEQLENLALKYFGIRNELGNIVGYMCPYSGEILTSFKDIVLEHIIPVNSKGGTVLFNCIPTSSKVNGFDEKCSKHLISWWKTSKYWDDGAPKRLEKLVNYILEAYEKVFKEYSVLEVESSYLTIDLLDDEDFEEEDNLEMDEREESQKQKEQAKDNGIHSYLGFILDCIKVLEQCEIDTNEIRNKLKELESNYIFDDIERYEIFQSVVQDVIKSTLGDDNKRYLTYSLGFNIKKLMDSITSSSKLDIYQEIKTRLTYIEMLLKQNNISLLDYYENLMDLDEINILYNSNINNITEKEINEFIETIKIGHETKIIIFIEMLNEGETEILKQNNNKRFKGYKNILVGQFWNSHKDKIKSKLDRELKDDHKYDIARQLIREYEFDNNLTLKISIFIEMLNEGNSNILKVNYEVGFKGYENILVGQFWNSHKDKIKSKLDRELKDDHKYDIARQLIREYEFENDINKRISIFIEMLNEGNDKILNKKNQVGFKGYEKFTVGDFWNNNKDKIIQKLKELENDPRYETALQTVLSYLKVSSIEEYEKQLQEQRTFKDSLSEDEQQFLNDINKRIDVFIEMLNEGNAEILNTKNQVGFKGYEKFTVGPFWHSNKDKIIQKLKELGNDPRYETALQTVLSYFKVSSIEEYEKQLQEQRTFQDSLSEDEQQFLNDINKRIDVFIEMLNEGNAEILKGNNGEYFKGYEKILVGQFWHSNKDKIKNKLKELENDPRYDKARRLIKNYEFDNNPSLKIDVFIEMLNEGKSQILKKTNGEYFKDYEIPVGRFWQRNKEEIIQKLKELESDSRYETALQTVLSYLKVSSIEEYEKQLQEQRTFQDNLSEDEQEFQKNLDKRIDVFIEMLNEGNAEILKQKNKEQFKGYKIQVGQFWHSNKDKIKEKLFGELMNDTGYETARQTVLSYFKVSSIEELEIKQKKGKTLKNLKQIKSDLGNVAQSYLSDDQQIKSNSGNVAQSYLSDDQHQNSNSENIIQFYPIDEQQSVRRA